MSRKGWDWWSEVKRIHDRAHRQVLRGGLPRPLRRQLQQRASTRRRLPLELPEPVPRESRVYEHLPTWQPPSAASDRLELDPEPDVDPDEVDFDAWADEVDGADD